MHTVIVLFKEQGSLQLLFEHLDHADKAYRSLAMPLAACAVWDVEVRDDYGTISTLDRREIRAVVIQDLAQHLKGAAMHSLLQQRAQAELQKKIASDPMLRFITPNGPIPGAAFQG